MDNVESIVLPTNNQPIIEPTIVPIDAIINPISNGLVVPPLPLVLVLLLVVLKFAPNNINGVAKLIDNNCNLRDVIVPPGYNIPTLAKKNVMAMADTGEPNNLPIRVLVPSICARTLVPVNTAKLPHSSLYGIKLFIILSDVDDVDVDDDVLRVLAVVIIIPLIEFLFFLLLLLSVIIWVLLLRWWCCLSNNDDGVIDTEESLLKVLIDVDEAEEEKHSTTTDES